MLTFLMLATCTVFAVGTLAFVLNGSPFRHLRLHLTRTPDPEPWSLR